jgi:hypothetical protein
MLAQKQKVRSTRTMGEHLQKIKRYGNASRPVGEGLGVEMGEAQEQDRPDLQM